ncbi:MAG: AAA family ATPase [Pseudazoarcus pumilus]|nr:AAA family ATPase [Pseudazoarcus pumilus]
MTDSIPIVAALVRAGRFPHPVGQVECIETHASWVILAGDYAYKIKKPLDLGFLDYSTPARRRAMCEEEVRLNRRTAPEIYEDVVGVYGGEGARIGPADGAPEFAVRMRRFDQAGLFAHLLADGALTSEHMQAVARHVADFHAGIAVAQPGQGFGSAEAVIFPVQQNFDQMRELVTDAALLAQIGRLEAWSAGESRRLASTFDARLAAGFVRECHGDLHLANIVWLDGRARLFDGIEFNPQLRWNDVMADVAFLVMDCEARGRADLANGFLDAWLEAGGDYDALPLLAYYVAYRAMVRAKVAAIRMRQAQGEEAVACREELVLYLDYALGRIDAGRAAVWIASGPSGAGKSFGGRTLVERRGAIRIRSDVERKRLAGLKAHDRATAAVGAGLYGPEMTERTYARLLHIVRAVVAAGRPALVDATFLKRTQRDRFRALAAQLAAPFVILAFDAPPDVLRERVAKRAAEGMDAADADVTVLEHQLATREPLGDDERALAVCIDTSQDVDWEAVLRCCDLG